MKKLNFLLVAIVAALCLAGSAWADYATEVLADSPLAYWRFEDATCANDDTAVDSGGRCWKNGTYIGDGLSFVSGIPGISGGQAVDFGSSDNDSVIDIYDGGGNEISNPGGVTRQTITLEAWMKSSDASNYPRLLQHNGSNSEEGCWGIGAHDSGYITMIGADNTWYTGTDNVFDGEWHHIVVTYQPGSDPNDIYEYVYIDGVGKWGNTVADANLSTDYNRLTIGSEGNRWGPPWNEFHGLLDEIAVYDTTLSSTRVAAHYAEGVPEPATLSLFGLGAIALIRRRRK